MNIIFQKLSFLKISIYTFILIISIYFIDKNKSTNRFNQYFLKNLCSVAFVFIIVLGIVNINHLSPAPSLYNSKGNLDLPAYSKNYSSWLEKNIGYRSQMIDLRSFVAYKLLKFSPSEKVALGKDGWLFYTYDNNIEIAKESYPMSNLDYKDAALSLSKIKQSLNSQDIKYLMILPCSKVSIYPEYLAGNYQIVETPTDKLKYAIDKYTDIDCISLKDSLLAAKTMGTLYYKTDTHWNGIGAWIGYKTIYDSLYS